MRDILVFVEKLAESDKAPWAVLLLIAVGFVGTIMWMISVVRKMNPVRSAEMLSQLATENAQRVEAQSVRHENEIREIMEDNKSERNEVMGRHIDALQQNSIAFTRFSETIDHFQTFLKDQRTEMRVTIEGAVAKGFAGTASGGKEECPTTAKKAAAKKRTPAKKSPRNRAA